MMNSFGDSFVYEKYKTVQKNNLAKFIDTIEPYMF